MTPPRRTAAWQPASRCELSWANDACFGDTAPSGSAFGSAYASTRCSVSASCGWPASIVILTNLSSCLAKVGGSACEAEEQGHKFVLPCEYLGGATTENAFFYDSCLFGDGVANHVGRVAGYAACKALMQKCVGWQKLDGALIHSLCDPSDECQSSAEAVLDMVPDCREMLESGTPECDAIKTKRIWNEAVTALCEPFGPNDFPSW